MELKHRPLQLLAHLSKPLEKESGHTGFGLNDTRQTQIDNLALIIS